MATNNAGKITIDIVANVDRLIADMRRGGDIMRAELARMTAAERGLASIDAFKAIGQRVRATQQQFRAAEAEVRRLGAAMSQARQGGGTPSADLTRQYQAAQQSVRQLSAALDQQRTALRNASAGLRAAGVDTSRLSAEYQRLQRAAADSAASQQASAGRVRSSLSGLAGNIATAAAGYLAFSSLKAGASELVQASARADRLDKAFQTIAGSASEADKQIGFIRRTSQTLGVDLVGAADGFLKLSAAANGTSLQGEQVQRIFTSIARASAALGLSTDDANGALRAIGQMISKGTVQSEELRGQLGERLPGAFQTAARAMGVTTQELGKLLEKGQVVAADFLPKFATELDKTFASARFDAVQNNLNRLGNAWESFKQRIAETGGVREGVQALTDAVSAQTDNLLESQASDLKTKSVDQLRDIQAALRRNLERQTAETPFSVIKTRAPELEQYLRRVQQIEQINERINALNARNTRFTGTANIPSKDLKANPLEDTVAKDVANMKSVQDSQKEWLKQEEQQKKILQDLRLAELRKTDPAKAYELEAKALGMTNERLKEYVSLKLKADSGAPKSDATKINLAALNKYDARTRNVAKQVLEPSRFDPMFAASGRKFGVDPLLIKQFAAWESGLNPNAKNVNTNGSVDRGIMQLNSRFDRERGVTNPFDPAQAIDVAARLISRLLQQTGGNLRETFRRYNGSGEMAQRYAEGQVKVLSAVTAAAGGKKELSKIQLESGQIIEIDLDDYKKQLEEAKKADSAYAEYATKLREGKLSDFQSQAQIETALLDRAYQERRISAEDYYARIEQIASASVAAEVGNIQQAIADEQKLQSARLQGSDEYIKGQTRILDLQQKIAGVQARAQIEAIGRQQRPGELQRSRISEIEAATRARVELLSAQAETGAIQQADAQKQIISDYLEAAQAVETYIRALEQLAAQNPQNTQLQIAAQDARRTQIDFRAQPLKINASTIEDAQSRASVRAQTIQASQSAGVLSASQAQQRLRDIYREAADSIKSNVDALDQLAVASNNPAFEQAAERAKSAWLEMLSQTKTPMEQLAAQWADVTGNMQQASASWANSFADTLTDMVTGGKATFAELAQSIIKDIASIAVKAYVVGPIVKMLTADSAQSGGEKTSGGTDFGSILSGLGSIFGSFFHTGGVAGVSAATTRALSPAVWSGAPRYHAGGIAGLAHDEIPAILQRGEIVVARGIAKTVASESPTLAASLSSTAGKAVSLDGLPKFHAGGLVGGPMPLRREDGAVPLRASQSSGGMKVVINDQRSAGNSEPVKTRQKRDQNGDMELEIMIRDKVVGVLDSGYADRSLGRTGGKRVPVRR